MKPAYLYIVIAALVILNLFLLIQFRKNGNLSLAKDHAHKENINNHSDEKAYINLLRGRIQMQAKYNSSIYVDSNATVMDTLGNNRSLKDLITARENLVFFFTQNHCYSCIDGAIPYLESLANQIGYDKIFLLADLNEKRDILTFKSKYNSKLRIYSIGDSSIHNEAKSLNYPFLFLINKSLTGHSLFFVEKDLPQVTEDFMHEMVLKFKNS